MHKPLLLCCLLLSLSACGAGGYPDDPATACNEANEGCGPNDCNGEGSQMLPGSDCLACHTAGSSGEGGDFSYGGTAFVDIDGTAPLVGATVRIIGNDGTSFETTTNDAGNFYGTQALSFPILAEIDVDGQTKAMVTPVSTGACSTCHMCGGTSGGKLYAP